MVRMATKNVPRFSWLAIIMLWANSSLGDHHQKRSVTMSSMTTTLSTKACEAFIKPNDLIVLNHPVVVGDPPEYHSIKCGAKLSNGDVFSYPAIDLSFGDNTQTGIFIVRGQPECKNNRCESEFRVATMALKKLLSNASLDATVVDKDKSPEVNHHDHHRKHRADGGGGGGSFVIRFKCDIADTVRNSALPVRCSVSGTIRYAKEIEYGQPCLAAMLNASSYSSASNKIFLEECGQNMQCAGTGTGNHKCKCKKAYVETRDISGKVICIESVAIFQKCIVNKQCTAKDPNTWCQSDPGLGYKTCQCTKNYHPEIASQGDRITCQPQKLVEVESGSSSYLNQSEDNVISQYALIIFLVVLFIVIIVAIIILSFTRRKHGIKQQYKQASKRAKSKKSNGNYSNGEGAEVAANKSVLGLAYNPQNGDVDEEIEVKIYDIDDQSDMIRRGNLAKVIQEPPDQETNLTAEQAPNFDIFAKQSVV